MNKETKKYLNFHDFYRYYISEHNHVVCRRLHVIGSAIVVMLALTVLLTQQWVLLWLLPVVGYGFAWVGHFFFEKNKPATFTYPMYSLLGDWVMFWQVMTGKIKF